MSQVVARRDSILLDDAAKYSDVTSDGRKVPGRRDGLFREAELFEMIPTQKHGKRIYLLYAVSSWDT